MDASGYTASLTSPSCCLRLPFASREGLFPACSSQGTRVFLGPLFLFLGILAGGHPDRLCCAWYKGIRLPGSSACHTEVSASLIVIKSLSLLMKSGCLSCANSPPPFLCLAASLITLTLGSICSGQRPCPARERDFSTHCCGRAGLPAVGPRSRSQASPRP